MPNNRTRIPISLPARRRLVSHARGELAHHEYSQALDSPAVAKPNLVSTNLILEIIAYKGTIVAET